MIAAYPETLGSDKCASLVSTPKRPLGASGLLVEQALHVHAFEDNLVQWVADTGGYLVYVYAINMPTFEGDHHASDCQAAGAIAQQRIVLHASAYQSIGLH